MCIHAMLELFGTLRAIQNVLNGNLNQWQATTLNSLIAPRNSDGLYDRGMTCLIGIAPFRLFIIGDHPLFWTAFLIFPLCLKKRELFLNARYICYKRKPSASSSRTFVKYIWHLHQNNFRVGSFYVLMPSWDFKYLLTHLEAAESHRRRERYGNT